jgi:hypothetical protein
MGMHRRDGLVVERLLYQLRRESMFDDGAHLLFPAVSSR